MGDTFLFPIRLGTDAATLMPGRNAILLDPAWFTVTDDPDTIATGQGAFIQGVTRVTGKGVGGYVAASIGAGIAGSATIWLNDTGAAVPVASLYLVPGADVAIDAVDYVVIKVSLSGTPIYTIRTDVTALTQGVAVAWGAAVTVPALGTLAMVVTGHGTPPSVALYTQGRLP